ncbi:structure-specific endonuclease subunit SLX4 [Magnaporthiopsis poae ATCC 64411]|uniref:Structure-specific endonuclease subunit SLX4 n=1 Tax=Magnaporthiopsis poae (strain ATCC 64411 / 73-15) TaxID=644358 RepID=A0A0C4E9Z9_MAGP6|nr:structure-specific endonuclease subunit SLX4 [Magnaporthiopsis poae ATCC 64411]
MKARAACRTKIGAISITTPSATTASRTRPNRTLLKLWRRRLRYSTLSLPIRFACALRRDVVRRRLAIAMTSPSRFLPSSPPRPPTHAPRSSSPDLPSVGELVARYTRKPPLSSGSSARPIPTNATASFTTASSLLRTSQATSAETQAFDPRRPLPKTTPQRSSAACDIIEISPDVSVVELEPLPRTEGRGRNIAAPTAVAPRAGENHGVELLDTTSPKTQPRKAFNSPPPKDVSEADPQPIVQAPSKVVKPAARKPSAPSRRKKAETVSRHFAPHAAEQTDPAKPVEPKPRRPKASKVAPKVNIAPVPEPVPVDAEVICLEPALPRRSDWTPPRETAAQQPQSGSPVDTQGASTIGPRGVFETLQDTFACPLAQTLSRSHSPEKDVPPVAVLKKRKAIQLIGPSREASASKDTSPTKFKAPKKKPRTITELATAAYVAPASNGASETAKPDSILNYLEPEQSGEHVLQHGHPVSRPRKPDRKRKGKQGRRQLLLSPISAMDQSARQDFVFGTSSQLAQEQSPTFLKELHQALRASNELLEDPFASPPVAEPGKGRKLWAAGARGEDGDVVDVEVIDLLDSPAFPEDPMAIVMAEMQKSPSDRLGKEKTKTAPAIDIESSASDSESEQFTAPAPNTQSNNIYFATQRPSSSPQLAPEPPASKPHMTQTIVLDEGAGDYELPPSNQEAQQIQQLQQQTRKNTQTTAPRPNFELMTDVQLASQVAKYGFKAIKRRTAMVALLEQCWVSKTGGVATAAGSGASMSTTASMARSGSKESASRAVTKSPVKKPRGRPTKDGPTPAAAPDLVSDATIPVKPRGRPKKTAATASSPKPRGRPKKTDSPEGSPKPRGRPKKTGSPEGSPKPRGRAKKAGSPERSPKSRGRTKKTASPERSPRPWGRTKKNSSSATTKTKTKATSTSRSPSPFAARARTPTRGKKTATQSAIEIADSDGEGGLSISSRSSPERIFSSPGAVDLSISEDVDMSLAASPRTTSRQSEVFGFIAKAVTTAPRSDDPANPSWHEKMLMYDPIVLEDLAAWLNSGQLDRVGFDGEVSSEEVKMWCESKSICCLWRMNLRGKERKRY